VRVWEVETRKMATFGLLHCYGAVMTVAFSPDGRLLAAADFGGRANFWWSGTDQQARTPLQANDKGIHDMVFSPDSTRVVTGGFDNAVRIWDIADGFPVFVISQHFDIVCSVGYSPDGRYIVSGSDDMTVRLWNSETGDAVLTLNGHGDTVETVAFAPDGRSIVSGSSDATIRVWDIEAALTIASEVSHDPLARLGSATLTHDGWLVGSYGELLLWLPPKYRGYIPLPPCSMIIGSYPVQLQVDEAIGGLHWGDEWAQCWRGAAHAAVQPSP